MMRTKFCEHLHCWNEIIFWNCRFYSFRCFVFCGFCTAHWLSLFNFSPTTSPMLSFSLLALFCFSLSLSLSLSLSFLSLLLSLSLSLACSLFCFMVMSFRAGIALLVNSLFFRLLWRSFVCLVFWVLVFRSIAFALFGFCFARFHTLFFSLFISVALPLSLSLSLYHMGSCSYPLSLLLSCHMTRASFSRSAFRADSFLSRSVYHSFFSVSIAFAQSFFVSSLSRSFISSSIALRLLVFQSLASPLVRFAFACAALGCFSFARFPVRSFLFCSVVIRSLEHQPLSVPFFWCI